MNVYGNAILGPIKGAILHHTGYNSDMTGAELDHIYNYIENDIKKTYSFGIDWNNMCKESWDLISKPKIKKVIFNDPATIVFWKDGTKTIVKAYDEEFDPEKGLAMAITKKIYGSNKELKKWLPKETKKISLELKHKNDPLTELVSNTIHNMAKAFRGEVTDEKAKEIFQDEM